MVHMTKRRVASWGCLVLVAAVVMVFVRDCVDLFWQGPTPRIPPRLATTRIELPEALTVHEARLGPDGLSQFILATPPPRREWWHGQDTWGWRRDPKALPPQALLYIRANQNSELRAIPGTEGARHFSISPDGHWIAFVAPNPDDAGRDYLWIMAGDGRSAPGARLPWSASWGHMPIWLNEEALGVSQDRGAQVLVIPRRAGEAPRVIRVEIPRGVARLCSLEVSSPVPGRSIVLCDVCYMDGPLERAGIGALDPKDGRLTILNNDGGNPRCLPDGRILFARENRLFITRAASAPPALRGAPVPLSCELEAQSPTGHASFELAKDGTLSQVTDGERTWADRGVVRRGSERGYIGSSDFRAAFDRSPVASPDGSTFATEILNADGDREIWVYREIQPYERRLISVPGDAVGAPVWSPDGSQVAYARFALAPQGGIYVVATGGSTPPSHLAANNSGRILIPTSWSPDGTTILCTIRTGEGSRVAVVRAAGGLQEPRVLLVGDTSRDARFSCDGRLVAFEAGESESCGVYVSSWKGTGEERSPLRVSSGGCRAPRWGRDGSLYYISPDRRIMHARIGEHDRTNEPTPSVAWDMNAIGAVDDLYDILPDARLLVVVRGTREGRNDYLTKIPRFVQQLPDLATNRRPGW